MVGTREQFVTNDPVALGSPIAPAVRRFAGVLELLAGQAGLVLPLKIQFSQDLTKLIRRNLGEMQWPRRVWGKTLQFSHQC